MVRTPSSIIRGITHSSLSKGYTDPVTTVRKKQLPIGETSARRDGHGSKLNLAAHITKSVHSRGGGVLELIHCDVAFGIQSDSSCGQVERVRQRVPASGGEYTIQSRQALRYVEYVRVERKCGESMCACKYNLLWVIMCE